MGKKMVKKTAKKTMKSSMAKKVPAKKASAKKVTVKSASKRSTSFKRLNTEELYDLISRKAYELYTERGAGHGDDHSDWYRAESYVRSKYKF